MIKASGATLRIKKIRQSRNGAFCVADLTTDFGEFKVKDTVLDQFDEGEYQATVWISEIFLAQYISYGKAVTEMRARLHDLRIESAGELGDVTGEPSEPDPLDEEQRAAKIALPVTAAVAAPVAAPSEGLDKPKSSRLDALKSKLDGIRNRSKQPTPAGNDAADDRRTDPRDDGSQAALFGEEIWRQIQLREFVKLDPTVPRAVLRQQAAAMHQLDYVFDPKQQAWNPK